MSKEKLLQSVLVWQEFLTLHPQVCNRRVPRKVYVIYIYMYIVFLYIKVARSLYMLSRIHRYDMFIPIDKIPWE